MENFSYHVPFYVVTNGVATQGYTSDLIGGQVGLFDRQNWAVATGSGVGKELFFAQGSTGGKGWYGEPVTESHKSPFFLTKDIVNIYKSNPARLQNEEWIVGFDGSASSKSLEFVKGKKTAIDLYFHGEPTYRLFNGPKEFSISYTPPVDCTTDCASDCDGTRQDPKPHAIELIKYINNFVELQKLGVRAKLVEDTYSAASPTKQKYTITVFDAGDTVALTKIQAQYPGSKIVRTATEGVKSTYEITLAYGASAPADFAYSGSAISLAVCGTCPSGFSTVAGKDIYFVNRPLSGTEDFSTNTTKQTYATAVATAYSATTGTFIGFDGSIATVKLEFPTATVVSALSADVVTLEYSVGTTCVAAAGSTVAWVIGVTGVSGVRTLSIKLKRPDCNASGDRLADITAALTGVTGVNIGSLTKVAGTGCFDDYTVTQNSDDFLTEDCLTSEVSFTYKTVLPTIDGLSWLELPAVVTPNTARKVGIRISAGYFDPKFGNCSFDPYDYYETMPLKMEVTGLIETSDNCAFSAGPTSTQTKIARFSRQTGEYVVRELIMKSESYLKHVDQWDANPRMREAFDMQVQNMVDRNAFYTLWYVTYFSSYNPTARNAGAKPKFTAVFAFKETDPKLPIFETNVINVLAQKSGIVPHVNS